MSSTCSNRGDSHPSRGPSGCDWGRRVPFAHPIVAAVAVPEAIDHLKGDGLPAKLRLLFEQAPGDVASPSAGESAPEPGTSA